MGKRALLWKLLQDIRASYWFIPSILVLFGLALATGMAWVDRNPDVLPFKLSDTLLDTQAEGARSTLAVIAQSIIGVTGVMFSMTLVAVSFASGNFGPRLIGNFMRDRSNQLSFGILIATFVYSLSVLRSVQDNNDGDIVQFVPHYSLMLALVLTVICIFTLIYFIHHVPETINVSRISAKIGNALERDIKKLIDENEDAGTPVKLPKRAPDNVVTSTASGYIQTVNFDHLSALAQDHDLIIRLAASTGTFVTAKTPVLELWGDTSLSDEDCEGLAACFAVGSGKTENQNPSFLAEQLVEMIARALSPGVNDPYTARDCLNRLAAALTVATTYKDGLSDPAYSGVTYDHLNFERLFAATFPLCRHYVQQDVLVLEHAKELLSNLLDVAQPGDQDVIKTELDALDAT